MTIHVAVDANGEVLPNSKNQTEKDNTTHPVAFRRLSLLFKGQLFRTTTRNQPKKHPEKKKKRKRNESRKKENTAPSFTAAHEAAQSGLREGLFEMLTGRLRAVADQHLIEQITCACVGFGAYHPFDPRQARDARAQVVDAHAQ